MMEISQITNNFFFLEILMCNFEKYIFYFFCAFTKWHSLPLVLVLWLGERSESFPPSSDYLKGLGSYKR